MAIIPKAKKIDHDAAASFVAGAPDAKPPQPEQKALPKTRKGQRIQITFTIQSDLLEKLDSFAAEMGQSRAAVINFAIKQMLLSGLHIEQQD